MKLSATLPQDDEGAKVIRFEDVRGQRYTEIFLIGGHVITRHLVGGVYNTIGLNDPTGTGDTSPQAVLDKVDVDALEEEYDLIRAFKNGPRLWTLDWVEVMVGAERDFSGLKARWVMWLDVADGAAGPGAQRGQLGDQGRHGVPGEAGPQVLGPGQDQGPGLVDRLGAFPCGAALGDHESTDGLNGAVAALGRAAGPAGLGRPGSADGIEGIGLTLPAAVLPVRAVDLDDADTGCGDVPGQARAVAAGALDPDQAHRPEPAQPAQ